MLLIPLAVLSQPFEKPITFAQTGIAERGRWLRRPLKAEHASCAARTKRIARRQQITRVFAMSVQGKIWTETS
jgi:hypothetical protein